MVIAEAYAVGLPVIASDLGSMASLVEHNRTGLRFAPGNPRDLAARVDWASTHVEDLERMRREARAEFETKYSAERNYRLLAKIYQMVAGRTEVHT